MQLSDLRGLGLTYAEQGATGGDPPAGYHHVRACRQIGRGRPRFEQAAAAVLRYGMLRGAGLRIQASTEVAEPGTDVLGRFGPFHAPCRVAAAIDETDRRGFAYGTLPGHPVRGEEMFTVRIDPSDEAVYAEVVAFSQPARWWSRLGAPAVRWVQRMITRRFVAAV